MQIGLIGLPQSGKSTVFTAATGQTIDPYAQPEVRHAMVRVPDPRLEYLTKLHNPKKVTEATIDFGDIPGFDLADAKGQEDLRKLLPTIRKMDLLVAVVRDFENRSVPAYKDRVDPAGDLEAVWDEMLFADLDTVTTRLERLEKALKKPTRTHEQEKKEQAVLTKCREALEENLPLSTVLGSEDDARTVSSFGFLTQKKLVCVRNVGEDEATADKPLASDHLEACITLSAEIEAEIATLDPEDRQVFMADLGLTESARDKLIRTCYEAAGLISFLTMGPDECRAWTIHKGDSAVDAAGKIHTDLARGFIRAETVAYADLVDCEDMKGAKAAGKVRKEGKTYIVQDGDILNILSSS